MASESVLARLKMEQSLVYLGTLGTNALSSGCSAP
jgi:hypothetical protein